MWDQRWPSRADTAEAIHGKCQHRSKEERTRDTATVTAEGGGGGGGGDEGEGVPAGNGV